MKKSDKKPKVTPPKSDAKRVDQKSDPVSSEGETPYWLLSTFDYSGPWGEAACKIADCAKHLSQHLKGFESMTWGEIKKASGGRTSGTNNHAIFVEDLSKIAQDRLTEIELDDLESLFSLRFENTVRMYGIRDGRVFKLLWLDPWHGDEDKAVCPSKKRHT